MTDIPTREPTKAPALTDEQIDFNLAMLREMIAAPPIGWGRTWDSTIAAVIARAKREAAEGIAQAIEAVDPVEWLLAGQYAGVDAAIIARRIGADHA